MRNRFLWISCFLIFLFSSGCGVRIQKNPVDEPEETTAAVISSEPVPASEPAKNVSGETVYQKKEKARLDGMEMELLSVTESLPAPSDRLSAGKNMCFANFERQISRKRISR